MSLVRRQQEAELLAQAEELQNIALGFIDKKPGTRTESEVTTIVTWMQNIKLLGSNIHKRDLLGLAKKIVHFHLDRNVALFFQGQKADIKLEQEGRGEWFQYGFYIHISGRIKLFTTPDKAQETLILQKYLPVRKEKRGRPKTPSSFDKVKKVSLPVTDMPLTATSFSHFVSQIPHHASHNASTYTAHAHHTRQHAGEQ